MPEHYLETVAAVGISRTNQVAELMGVLNALNLFIEATTKGDQGDHPLKFIQIMSDSEYACKGTNQHVNNWANNGWLKKDGTQPANLDIWKQIYEATQTIRTNGGIVKLDWVRGHDGDIGNERTDILATMGIFHLMRNLDETYRQDVLCPADGYWKIDNEHHPMLAHKCTYFNTLPGSAEKGTYYLGNHGKDEELLGSRMSDGSFAVVKLDEPDSAIENIREIQARYSKGVDSLFSANLTHLFDADVTYFTNTYGELGIRPVNEYRLDLDFAGKKPLTREYKPARISMRAVDALELLEQHLSDFLEGKDNIKSTDITALLYESTTKTVKGVEENILKLRPEIVVGLAALDTELVNPIHLEGKPYKLTLTVGQDLLARNSLKRLEDLNPQVYVVTWLEGEKAFRYATVIKAKGCVGIWAGYYSNLRLIA
jgi:ribonuclease HI